MISTHALTLRLQWSADGSREISVPVEVRKGSYAQRYELYVDGVHVGWVVKHKGLWESFITSEQNNGWGVRQASFGESTRGYAIADVVSKLADYARTNVLAARARAAYADVDGE